MHLAALTIAAASFLALGFSRATASQKDTVESVLKRPNQKQIKLRKQKRRIA